MLSRYREGFVHRVYGSEKGIGAPDRPVNRQDKNVRKWYLSIVRHALYFLDAIHLAMVFDELATAEPMSSFWIATSMMSWPICHSLISSAGFSFA